MTRRVAPFLLLAACPVACLVQGPWPEVLKPEPSTLAVVVTWADLLKQPAIKLPDGGTVRLGISTARCPQWDAAVLYAYTENFDPQYAPHRPCGVGPVYLRVEANGRPVMWSTDPIDSIRVGLPCPDDSPRLFARPVPIDRPGRYLVRVCRGDEDVARAVVEGTDYRTQPFQPWSPLLLLKPEDGQEPPVVARRPDGVALPLLGGVLGMHVTKRDQAPDAKLPLLLPDRPDPAMTVTLQTNPLTLRVPAPEATSTSRPDLWFLARWWVNDRPLQPTQAEPVRADAKLEPPASGRGFVMRLAFDPRKCGAKSGDRVAVQLLYCPGGWDWVMYPPGDGGEFPRLTNRVEFRVP